MRKTENHEKIGCSSLAKKFRRENEVINSPPEWDCDHSTNLILSNLAETGPCFFQFTVDPLWGHFRPSQDHPNNDIRFTNVKMRLRVWSA